MDQEKQKEFEARVLEVQAFAKEKEVGVFAVQQVSKEGYIETVPMFRNLKLYEEKK